MIVKIDLDNGHKVRSRAYFQWESRLRDGDHTIPCLHAFSARYDHMTYPFQPSKSQSGLDLKHPLEVIEIDTEALSYLQCFHTTVSFLLSRGLRENDISPPNAGPSHWTEPNGATPEPDGHGPPLSFVPTRTASARAIYDVSSWLLGTIARPEVFRCQGLIDVVGSPGPSEMSLHHKTTFACIQRGPARLERWTSGQYEKALQDGADIFGHMSGILYEVDLTSGNCALS